MPYASEHAARVCDPGDFLSDSFRRKTIAPGVDLIAGKLSADGKNGPMVAQAYRFDASAFSAADARAWCRTHGVRPILFEEAAQPAAQVAASRAALVARLAASAPGPGGTYRTTLRATDDGLTGLPGLPALRLVAAAEPMPEGMPERDEEDDDDRLIRRRYRLFSADVDVCDSYSLWTRTPEAVLAEGAVAWSGAVDARGLRAPVPVILGHDRREIPCGVVEAPEFVGGDGFLPAGIEATIAIDPKINAAAARAVEVGLIRAVSSCIEFEWRPSHSDLELQAFCEQLGEVVDGARVVLEMTAICAVPEVSLVLYGAEPYSTTLEASAPAPAPPAPPVVAAITETIEAGTVPASSLTSAAGTPPAPDRQEARMPLSEIRAALGLPDQTEPAAITAAVQALRESNASLSTDRDRLAGELAALRAEQAKKEIDAEIEAALKVGRFAPAERPKIEAIAVHGIEVLRATLALLPARTIPVDVVQAAGGRVAPEQPSAPVDPPGADPGLRAKIQKVYKQG